MIKGELEQIFSTLKCTKNDDANYQNNIIRGFVVKGRSSLWGDLVINNTNSNNNGSDLEFVAMCAPS